MKRIRSLVRRLSAWAWDDMLFDVGRVEWKYGRNENGTPKNWTEWNNVRVHLREAGKLRQPQDFKRIWVMRRYVQALNDQAHLPSDSGGGAQNKGTK